jgi:hypothetical protein
VRLPFKIGTPFADYCASIFDPVQALLSHIDLQFSFFKAVNRSCIEE